MTFIGSMKALMAAAPAPLVGARNSKRRADDV
jgi:hypothetical protein